MTDRSKVVLYSSPDGRIEIEVFLLKETVWLTQKKLAELFNVDIRTISEHLQNIFNDGELDKKSVIRKFRNTASDGKSYLTQFYNLDAIISVGYRVNSQKATQFRIWATGVLREYIIKGFALNDDRLKSGESFDKRYFDELLERIRDIRASERLFYQKITDIYAQCSVDYDPNSKITKEFYATVQNKLHWAIHGHTAAEIISQRADASKQNMGLTTWRNSPKGKVRKADVSIAKNYLSEKELKQLNRIVTMYLDYAEMQAENHKPMPMKDWVGKLDTFIKFNEREVLTNPGKVSAEVAKVLAENEYEKYKENQKKIEVTQPVSDFDRLVEKSKKLVKKTQKEKRDGEKTVDTEE